MDEQRTQAYLNLINQLLTCNNGDEPRILQENQELVDRGLIETMVAVARQYGEAGRENEAQWLMNVAQQLAQALGIWSDETTATANTPQDYLNFLLEVLQKVAEDDNPQLIYPFLQQNLDKLDENLITVLASWAKDTLSSVDAETATYNAGVIVNFSNLIQQFPLGNIATNFELAITGYEIALTVFTYDAFPQDWAKTQYNLAIAYLNRIRGDKAENLERAITAYAETLKVFTFEAFPQQWATTQNNLANAYRKRIRGDKAENIEQAIKAYTETLKVYTFDAFPQQWATVQTNLANAYSDRIRGDKAGNLEAESGFQASFNFLIEVLQKVADDPNPQLIYSFLSQNLDKLDDNLIKILDNWEKEILSSAQTNQAYNIAADIGNFSNLIKDFPLGKIAVNKEIAITGYQIALTVFTFDAFPQQWAMTQHNLASAYCNRIRGDKADNLERAIAAYTEALKVRTFDTFPFDWATTQNNLGNAYLNRIREDKAENLEKAITAYTEALKVLNFDAFPKQWAMAQNNLAIAYSGRIRGDKAENVEKAITYYQEALKVRTFDGSPQDWAETQNNLAAAYSDRIRGDKAENVEKAITAYTEALKVRTFDAFPKDWAITQNNLAIAYFNRIRGDKAENIEKAISAYTEALKVLTFDDFPKDWAMAQNNLGNAYLKRVRGDKAENIEKAISAYTEVLKVYTFDAFPQNWASTQNNLATAYRNRIRGNKAENLEKAIAAYTEALKVYTFDAFPQDWAMTQNNLAIAYRNKIRGDEAENLEAESGFQASFNFLIEVLQKVTDDPNPQLIYPFLAQNLDKLDENLAQILDSWAIGTLSRATPEEVYSIAEVMFYFSNLIQQFPLGNIAANLEIAITGYQIALTICTFDAFPQEWASTQNNLATAYSDRIRGNKAENLEKAIAAYTEALKVYTFDTFPQDWATTKNSLGVAYRNRIRGDKAENLEEAIAAYTETLKVYTFDAFFQQWAMAQNNLGNAYYDRIRGDKAENLERAIIYYQEALKVYTFDVFPVDWASTQNNLATAYLNRIRGDKAENLERAIIYYQEALRVRTFNTFPVDWASTQNNLATAYLNRIRGDKAENLEQAIIYYQEALRVRTFYSFPQQWATTQNNLGNAYLDRIKGDKTENLERVIAGYTEALKVYTFDAFPQEWAMTQNNLATAYRNRIRGEKAENLEQAIASYHNALRIQTKEDDPLKCLETARNLASLLYREKQWQPATEAYNTAIEAVENARLEALNPQSRQETLSNAIGVFHRIVQAHLNLNQPEKALEYIERSKARNLVELMTQKNVKPQGVSQEIIDKLDELRQRWVNEQISLQSRSINQNISSSDKLMPYISDDSYLREYRQAWEDFIDKEITPIDPNFKQTQIVQPIPFKDIQALTDAETCLLQWYITSEKIFAFVVSADGYIKYWESSEADLQALIDAIDNYLQLYNDFRNHKNTQWKNELSTLLQTFADTLHINDILALIPNTCQRLIIIPHWFLHILPLHALPVSNSNVLKFGAGANAQDLHDLFPNGVQYAPSCQLLKISQSFHHSDFNKLFAIQNPTENLPYADLEVNILSTFFTESQIIAKDNATKNAIIPHLKSSNNHCHHFSCHGGFNPNNPLESALLLANQELLTLGEIFELRLNKCRLVTLSACETGLIDLNSISDEYIGLPSGFLFAGSPSVVSSLWTVDDLSTSFLMMKFYEILFDENQSVSVAVALKEAQDWLQNLTVKEIEENLAKPTFQQAFSQLQQTLSSSDLFELQDAIALRQTKWKAMSPDDKPFNNPFYWAAFVASGV